MEAMDAASELLKAVIAPIASAVTKAGIEIIKAWYPGTSDAQAEREAARVVGQTYTTLRGSLTDNSVKVLTAMSALVTAAGKPPALSNTTPLVTITQEIWTATGAPGTFASATAAHQFVRYQSGVAQPAADAAAPLNLAGV